MSAAETSHKKVNEICGTFRIQVNISSIFKQVLCIDIADSYKKINISTNKIFFEPSKTAQ